MIGSTNSIWKVNGKYEQLVNYTMLYDHGDECTDLTGGWKGGHVDSTYKSGGWEKTSTALRHYENDKNWYGNTGFVTQSSINTTPYSCLVQLCSVTNYKSGYASAKPTINNKLVATSDTLDSATNIKQASYNAGGNVTNKWCVLDVSNINQNAYVRISSWSMAVAGDTIDVSTHAVILCASDDWQALANKAEITATSIDDILTNSTTLLSNEKAVEFMIYNCTGDFMVSAIQSSTFLTALNNSQYKTIIQANDHWSKFLNMVA